MSAKPGLFPAPPPDHPALSAGLAHPAYRLTPGEHARWTRLTVRTVDCQECALLQHEQRGAYGPRRQAKWRRRLAGGGPLALCSAHAQAWRARDDTDTAPRREHR